MNKNKSKKVISIIKITNLKFKKFKKIVSRIKITNLKISSSKIKKMR